MKNDGSTALAFAQAKALQATGCIVGLTAVDFVVVEIESRIRQRRGRGGHVLPE